MSLFFGIIGNVVAVALAAKAFYEAETRGRIIILALVGATFLAPRVFPGISLAAFIARLLVGMGCYFFLKARGEL
jgi:ABC-type spermidine/putrescine transport system permease subunit II